MKKTLTILSVCLAAAHPLSAEETLEVGTQSPDSQALGAEITETVETDVPPAFPSSETENLSDTVITETDDGITETDHQNRRTSGRRRSRLGFRRAA